MGPGSKRHRDPCSGATVCARQGVQPGHKVPEHPWPAPRAASATPLSLDARTSADQVKCCFLKEVTWSSVSSLWGSPSFSLQLAQATGPKRGLWPRTGPQARAILEGEWQAQGQPRTAGWPLPPLPHLLHEELALTPPCGLRCSLRCLQAGSRTRTRPAPLHPSRRPGIWNPREHRPAR